jgi:hypothetical protein
MPAGTCTECGADKVRCKGLCRRCYATVCRDRRNPGRWTRTAALADGTEGMALERAWAAHQLVVALVRELPEPGRHQGASWAARAACRDHPGLRWDGTVVTAELRAVCDACTVRGACLAEALADPTVAGVWAATTAAERRRLRR